jgi:hypothetical protein
VARAARGDRARVSTGVDEPREHVDAEGDRVGAPPEEDLVEVLVRAVRAEVRRLCALPAGAATAAG